MNIQVPSKVSVRYPVRYAGVCVPELVSDGCSGLHFAGLRLILCRMTSRSSKLNFSVTLSRSREPQHT